MNLRDLKYIIAVAESRHFGKAAERCFVSQPTLSGQIKKLEDQLGIAIFERTNRSVEITPVGEEILAHARRIMEQVDGIEQVARVYQDPLAGPLRIVTQSFEPWIRCLAVPIGGRRPCRRASLVLLSHGCILGSTSTDIIYCYILISTVNAS